MIRIVFHYVGKHNYRGFGRPEYGYQFIAEYLTILSCAFVFRLYLGYMAVAGKARFVGMGAAPVRNQHRINGAV